MDGQIREPVHLVNDAVFTVYRADADSAGAVNRFQRSGTLRFHGGIITQRGFLRLPKAFRFGGVGMAGSHPCLTVGILPILGQVELAVNGGTAGAEGGRRNAGGVLQVSRHLERTERIGNLFRVLHAVVPYLYGILGNHLGLGVNVYAVRTGDGKAVQGGGVTIDAKPAAHLIEGKADFAVRRGHALVNRGGRGFCSAVYQIHCGRGHPLAHRGFIRGMDGAVALHLIGQARIIMGERQVVKRHLRHSLRAVGPRVGHGLPEISHHRRLAAALHGIIGVRRDMGEDQGHLRILKPEHTAPVLLQQAKHVGIHADIAALQIGFALVPDRAGHAVASQRADFLVV